MFEVKVHIFTDGDFELPASSILDYDYELYEARRFFNTKDEASHYIDQVFIQVNNAYNIYDDHGKHHLIERLHFLTKDKNYVGESVPDLSSAIYLVGNQEFEIEVIEHTKSKKEFLQQRISDLREEYFDLYGTYPKIIGKAG